MRKLPGAGVAAILFTIVTIGSAPAMAAPRLIAVSPADGAVATQVRTLSIGFSEPVLDTVSRIDLVMTAMPGMASHAPMVVTGFQTRLTEDGKTLIVTLPRALPAGTYSLGWRVGGAADGAPVEGQTRFSVR